MGSHKTKGCTSHIEEVQPSYNVTGNGAPVNPNGNYYYGGSNFGKPVYYSGDRLFKISWGGTYWTIWYYNINIWKGGWDKFQQPRANIVGNYQHGPTTTGTSIVSVGKI